MGKDISKQKIRIKKIAKEEIANKIRLATNDAYREEHKEFLIIFPHAVVNPGAMVVHFSDAPLADRAMMGPLWLDADALRAFEYHLPLSKA